MNFRAFIGIPYQDHGRDRDGCDCWGLVRLVLREAFGADVPDHAAAYEHAKHKDSVETAIRAGLAADWRRKGDGEWLFEAARRPAAASVRPAIGDLIIFNIGGRPLHTALLSSVRPLKVLHVNPGMAFSCNEPLARTVWCKRIEGCYGRA